MLNIMFTCNCSKTSELCVKPINWPIVLTKMPAQALLYYGFNSARLFYIESKVVEFFIVTSMPRKAVNP